MRTLAFTSVVAFALFCCARAADRIAANSNTLSAPEGTPDAVADAAQFVEKCAMCHRQNGMGTNLLARRVGRDHALLESRTDLTPEWIRAAVRQGLGNMPRISRGEVSDEQLRAVTRYLTRIAGKSGDNP